MLPVSADFTSAIQNDTMEVIPRIRWWFSWNHLLTPTVTLGMNTSIDADLFPPESVLNSHRQSTSGSAYAIVGDSYTSTNPRHAYRVAPSDAEVNPILQLTTRTTGGGGNTTAMSQIDVDYATELDANVIEIQLETLRSAIDTGNFHGVNVDVFYKNTSDAWVSAFTGTITTNAEGRLLLYWDGTAWSTTEQDYNSRTTIKGVRLEVDDTNTAAAWNPKIRYVGAHDVQDVTDDIVSFSVTKSESQQLTYMPFSEPVTNTANLVLDNTAQKYAFKPVGETQPYYDLNMRFDFELGIDLTYIGGTGIEYIPLGTFYMDSQSYSTDLEISMDMSDYSKFWQRKFLDDCFWIDKSYKYVIKDMLARTGMDAGAVAFDLGIDQIDNETQTLDYVWYKNDTLLWDGLSDIVKSELGTFFVQEDRSYLFTDRGFLNNKIDAGVQWTIDADIDLESANQDFTVDANEVEIAYTHVGKNIDSRGIVQPEYVLDENGDLVLSYTTTGETEISSVLWEPGSALVLSAAPLYATMTNEQDFVRLTRPLGETFPETGTINIEGEYIDYDGKTIETNYVELSNLVRGTRGTTADGHDDGAAQVTAMDAEQATYHTASAGPTVTTSLVDGRFVAEQACTAAVNTDGDDYNTFTAWRPSGTATNPGGSDYAYGCRFHFEDFSNQSEESNMAGMFVHAKPSTWAGDATLFDTYWIEVVSMSEMINQDFITGSLRVYRTSDKNPISARNGLPPTTDNAIYGHDGIIIGNNIPVNIDVYWDSDAELFTLYVNDVFITSWQASYTDGEIQHPDAQTSPSKNNYYDANLTGNWGVFVRGNTKAAFEYVYAGAIDRGAEQFVSSYIYGGFSSQQYLTRTGSQYFKEFGSIAHELRRFEIDHQVYPNRWARIFHSNEYEAQIVYQTHTSFRSMFEVVNTSRSPAVLVGNDQSIYNHGLGANHQFFVYGSTVIEIESGESTARDKEAIRKRGISNVRVESPWIQTDSQAKRIADWVTANWAEPVDFYDVEWFPMWALQPGDRVDIDYPEKGF